MSSVSTAIPHDDCICTIKMIHVPIFFYGGKIIFVVAILTTHLRRGGEGE